MPCGCPYWQDTKNKPFILDQWVHFQQALEGILYYGFLPEPRIGKSQPVHRPYKSTLLFIDWGNRHRELLWLDHPPFSWLGAVLEFIYSLSRLVAQDPFPYNRAVFSFPKNPNLLKDGLPSVSWFLNFIVVNYRVLCWTRLSKTCSWETWALQGLQTLRESILN